MEENTTGLGDGRDDEIDFTFDDQEEEAVDDSYDTNIGDWAATGQANESAAVDAAGGDNDMGAVSSEEAVTNPNLNQDNEGEFDGLLYDDDDDDDDDERQPEETNPLGDPFAMAVGGQDTELHEQEQHDADEIDYEDDGEPTVDHDEYHESVPLDQMGRASGSVDEQPEGYDYHTEGMEDPAQPVDENVDLGDHEANNYAWGHDENTSHQSETANAESLASDNGVNEATRNHDDDLGTYETSSPHVMVTWGDDVCPLFKSSESDDPSSFFLDDLQALNYPLSKFLTAIRANITRWVDAKDEIHVCIDELGFEFSETTTPALLEQVTFQHLVALHEKLVQNDGYDTSQALHLTLSTKKNCTLRLGDLIEAANTGQGLSAVFSEPHSNMTSEPDNDDTVSYDRHHGFENGDDQDMMNEAATLLEEEIDEAGDDSHTLNIDQDGSRGASDAVSPQPGANTGLGWAPDASAEVLDSAPGVDASGSLAGSEGTGLQRSAGVLDEAASPRKEIIDFEVEPISLDAVAAAMEPTTEDQLDLIDYSNEIVSHGIDEGASAEELLAEMPSMDMLQGGTAALGTDIYGQEVRAQDGVDLPIQAEADLTDFTVGVVGGNGVDAPGVDGKASRSLLSTRDAIVVHPQGTKFDEATQALAHPFEPRSHHDCKAGENCTCSCHVATTSSEALLPASSGNGEVAWEYDFDLDMDYTPTDWRSLTNMAINLDPNAQIDALQSSTVDATLGSSAKSFGLDEGQGDDQYLDLGETTEVTHPLTGGDGTTKVVSEEQHLDLNSHAETSQNGTAMGDELASGDTTASLAPEHNPAAFEQKKKDHDPDEIDWDDEDKDIVPITPTSATPNANGKRTRDADEAEGLVDSGHDLKRHRPEQLLS